MTTTFGDEYARHYDQLYREKDYDAEVAQLARVFERHGMAGSRVLDLGCGTGQHAVRLARLGFEVTGVDRSRGMLDIARVKAEQSLDELAPPPRFVDGDVTTVRLDGPRFDAALMMFAVLGYQVTNEAVGDALRTVREHLRPGGLFVGDVWYGPAVLSVRPSDRTQVIDLPTGQIIRSVHASLDSYAHRADVSYRLWRLESRVVTAEAVETHRVRFFFPQELVLLLERAGLELVSLTDVADPDRAPSETSWNVLVVARAV